MSYFVNKNSILLGGLAAVVMGGGCAVLWHKNSKSYSSVEIFRLAREEAEKIRLKDSEKNLYCHGKTAGSSQLHPRCESL